LATLDVYRALNEHVNKALGKKHGSVVTIDSINQNDFVEALANKTLDKLILKSSLLLQVAGCEFLIIACNTAHLAYESVRRQLKIPILHIADTCAKQAIAKKAKVLGLLGSTSVMENKGILIDRLQSHGLTVLVPEKPERSIVHHIIDTELSCNILDNKDSKAKLLVAIQHLIQRGAEGIILGCTELPLVIKPADVPTNLVLLDTAGIQAEAAASVQLGKSKLADYAPPATKAKL